jgi:cytochrome P450
MLAQPYTFILAGYETTAVALAYTIYCLARHPEVEERLIREVDAFGRERPVSMESLEEVGGGLGA